MTTDEDRKKATRVITQAAGSELWTKPLIDAVAQAIAEERDWASRDGYLTGYGDRDENRDSKYGGF